ncbi:MAG TPA: ISNCY family transposase [Rhabdochlamydiaceae bacterium]
MSNEELKRTSVFSKLQAKALTQQEAADDLGITTRQVRRLFKDYKKHGAIALVSKKRGRPSNHQLLGGVKELVLAIIQDKYPDFGPTLAHEKIVEVHKIKISVWSVRRLMIVNTLWIDKKIKRRRIYQLRERRGKEGELVQMDGSPHDWFEGRGPKCTLLLCVDDATGKIKAAIFAPTETFWGYFDLMRIYLKTHGKPVALYNDKHGVFRVNKSGALSGDGFTQFGRAIKELEIQMVFANSPQAKGRIERSNRTLQDRLVKELRLNKISSIEEANAYLPTFIEEYNRRFAVIPKDPTNAHKPLEKNLDLIFTTREFRYLSKNLTFQYKTVFYQIWTERQTYALRNAKVIVREKKDGSIEVLYKNKPLKFRAYHRQEKQGEVADSKNLNEIIDNLQKRQEQPKPKHKPSLNHPWKRGARKWLYGGVS